MQNIRNYFKFSLFFVMLMFLAGCAQNITVQTPTHSPETGKSQLSLIPPANIYLKKVQDVRAPGRAEGSREAAFGVPMGNVTFDPPAAVAVQDLIAAELIKAGHSILDKEQKVNVAARVLAFEVGTDVTLLYWDIIGKTKIEVSVIGLSSNEVKKVFSSSCEDRTYVWPSGKLIKKVMQSCMSYFAARMRNDIEIAQAIKSMTEK